MASRLGRCSNFAEVTENQGVETREVVLARRLLNGDEAALEEFVVFFRSRLFEYSNMMCGHRDDAEDVTQDALLSAFRHFHELRDPLMVRSWIFRIARNACYMRRRRSVFAPERELTLEELGPRFDGEGESRALEIADWSRLPDEEVLQKELKEQLREAFAALPEMYRSVLLLRDVEGVTTEEAATILDISRDVVKQRLHRARLAVRKQLDGYLRGTSAYA